MWKDLQAHGFPVSVLKAYWDTGDQALAGKRLDRTEGYVQFILSCSLHLMTHPPLSLYKEWFQKVIAQKARTSCQS